MLSPKKIVVAALAALSLNACTENPPPPPKTVVAVIPSKIITPEKVELRDAGAPLTVVSPVEPIDPLVLAHDSKDVDHLGRAKKLQADGDAKGALLEARRALFSTPEDVDTLSTVARLSSRTGQSEYAAEAWGRIAKLTPDDAMPLIQQARAMIKLKDFSGAVSAGRDASTRDQGNAEAFQVTGIAQLSMNDLKGAIASFEKAVELNPEHGWAQNNLGFAYLRANENVKAVKTLTVAAELLPTVAYVHNNLGVALERTGQKEEAKVAYQHAMDLSPKYVKARINAARVAKVQDDASDVDPGTVGDETMSDMPHPMPEQE